MFDKNFQKKKNLYTFNIEKILGYWKFANLQILDAPMQWRRSPRSRVNEKNSRSGVSFYNCGEAFNRFDRQTLAQHEATLSLILNKFWRDLSPSAFPRSLGMRYSKASRNWETHKEVYKLNCSGNTETRKSMFISRKKTSYDIFNFR